MRYGAAPRVSKEVVAREMPSMPFSEAIGMLATDPVDHTAPPKTKQLWRSWVLDCSEKPPSPSPPPDQTALLPGLTLGVQPQHGAHRMLRAKT